MTLLHPEQLVWGLLAIPLILLAVWQRSQQHAVSSNHIWDAVLAERSWFERARRPLALTLRVASLELLVFAAADPRLNPTDAGTVVLVVDVSASMKATVAGGSRFDLARALARRSMDELPPGQRMALLSAGSVTRVACDLTGDRNRLRTALDAIRPTDGTADLVAAIALAEDLIPNARRGRIVVATDGTRAQSRRASPAANVEWMPLGDAADNVGITRCEIRPRLASPAELELLVEVLNAGSAAGSCLLEIDFRGQAVDRSTLAIPAGKSLRKFKLIDNAEGGLLTVRLNHADALAADNVGAVQVPERRPTRVTLVTSGNRAAQAALASLSGVDLTVTGEAPGAGPPPDLLIWDGQVPARLPSGPNLVLAPTTNCDLWKLSAVATGSVVVRDQVESPPVAHVDFTQAVLEDPIQLDFNLPAGSLVSSADGIPIYSLLERAAGDVLVLHVGIEKTDLAARGMLPILFADALRSFSLQAARYEPAVTTADLVLISPAEMARRLLPPQDALGKWGTDLRIEVEPRQGVVGPLDKVGLWQVVLAAVAMVDKAAEIDAGSAEKLARPTAVTADSVAAVAIASQLTNRLETEVNVVGARTSVAAGSASDAGGATSWNWLLSLQGGPLWPCFAVLALLLLVSDAISSR